MRVFLSHVAEEVTAAAALKTALERTLPGVEVWTSSADLRAGSDWRSILSLLHNRIPEHSLWVAGAVWC
jgi:hypothetical protein